MTDADKTALGWYNQNIQGRYCQRCGACRPTCRGRWISASLTVVSCMPTVTGEWTGAGGACRAGAAARTVLGLCGLHSPVRPRYRAAAPDGGGQKRCSAERACAGGAAVRMELSTKQPEGQASEEFNGQAGFSETGGFWNGRAGRRHGLRRRGLCRPRPTRAPPHFVRSAAPG